MTDPDRPEPPDPDPSAPLPTENAEHLGDSGHGSGQSGGAGQVEESRPSGESGRSGCPDPGDEAPEPRPSGLRNPAAAVRGTGAAALALEALVLLLAIAPLRMLGGRWAGWGIGAAVVLAVVCAVLAGLLKHRWAWYAALVVQALVVVAGIAQWAIAVLGVVFGAIWLYVLHLRRTILGTPRPPAPADPPAP